MYMLRCIRIGIGSGCQHQHHLQHSALLSGRCFATTPTNPACAEHHQQAATKQASAATRDRITEATMRLRASHSEIGTLVAGFASAHSKQMVGVE